MGRDDAEVLAKRLYDGTRDDYERWMSVLMNQANFEFSIRMPIDGVVSQPFSARTLKP